METLENLIDVFITTGLLVKVRSYGKTFRNTRKTSKFLFISPSLRFAKLNNIYLPGIEGKELEDYFTLIFEENIKQNYEFGSTRLLYDFAQKGADFILSFNDRANIVIEVDFNKDKAIQIENTKIKLTSFKYGLIFGSNSLEYIGNEIIKVPLRFLVFKK